MPALDSLRRERDRQSTEGYRRQIEKYVRRQKGQKEVVRNRVKR